MTSFLWTTKCSYSGEVFLFFICFAFYLCINSEGRIIEEAKKKNDIKCLRSESVLSGQVEDIDKVR